MSIPGCPMKIQQPVWKIKNQESRRMMRRLPKNCTPFFFFPSFYQKGWDKDRRDHQIHVQNEIFECKKEKKKKKD